MTGPSVSETRSRPRLGLVAVALAAVAAPLHLQAQDDTRPGVAVFELEAAGSVGEDGMDMENLGIGLQAMLINEFRQNSALRVVERRELNRILQEIELGGSGAVDQGTAAEAGRLVGARYMVFGSITDLFGEVVLTARVVDVETGELIRSGQQRDAREELYDVLVRTAAQITEDLDLPPLAPEIREARQERDVPPGAVLLLANAEAARDEGRDDRAIELYQRLTREFPEYTDAHTALEQLLSGDSG
ncbi:MAG TPA: CsgG/HfaB family protein [Longimicrobiales bacterium]|nr:CsgG/HfaB family protein [Longimicrobiales bacterium]